MLTPRLASRAASAAARGSLQRGLGKMVPHRRAGVWRGVPNRAKERSGIDQQQGIAQMFDPGIRLAAAAALVVALAALPADAADKVSFGTDWKAEAEHGGFYQALA